MGCRRTITISATDIVRNEVLTVISTATAVQTALSLAKELANATLAKLCLQPDNTWVALHVLV